MKRRILVLGTDGPDREDGNIYYSKYVIVETNDPALQFGEPIFNDVPAKDSEAVLADLRLLGYDVIEAPVLFGLVGSI